MLSCRLPNVDGDGGGDGCGSTDCRCRWRLLLRTSCAGDGDDGGDVLDRFGLLRGASDSGDDGGDAGESDKAIVWNA